MVSIQYCKAILLEFDFWLLFIEGLLCTVISYQTALQIRLMTGECGGEKAQKKRFQSIKNCRIQTRYIITLQVSKTCRVIVIEVLKTQMGTTLSSCSHFVAFELLHPRRQATVMWLVAFSSSSCLRILLIYYSTHRFLVLPFTASPSSCPLDLPCG